MGNFRDAFNAAKIETIELTVGRGSVPVAHIAGKIAASGYNAAVLGAAGAVRGTKAVAKGGVRSAVAGVRGLRTFINDVSNEVNNH